MIDGLYQGTKKHEVMAAVKLLLLIPSLMVPIDNCQTYIADPVNNFKTFKYPCFNIKKEFIAIRCTTMQ